MTLAAGTVHESGDKASLLHPNTAPAAREPERPLESETCLNLGQDILSCSIPGAASRHFVGEWQEWSGSSFRCSV